jgi:hypothetical protein
MESVISKDKHGHTMEISKYDHTTFIPNLQLQCLEILASTTKHSKGCQIASIALSLTTVQRWIHINMMRVMSDSWWIVCSHTHSNRKVGCDDKITQEKSNLNNEGNYSPHFLSSLYRIGSELYKNIITINRRVKNITNQRQISSTRAYDSMRENIL